MFEPINQDRLQSLLLVVLWCQRDKPATLAAVMSGMKTLIGEPMAGPAIAGALDDLSGLGRVEKIAPAKPRGKPEFRITAAGAKTASDFAGRVERPPGVKPLTVMAAVTLPAMMLGLTAPDDSKKGQSLFGKLLPIAVCARELQLPIVLDQGPDVARLSLVKLALSRTSGAAVEKIYLKKLPTGELPALVAGPLLNTPATAAKNLDTLLVMSAMSILQVSKPAQIKSAVIRRWLRLTEPAAEAVVAESSTAGQPVAATAEPAIAEETSPEQFAQQVQRAARSVIQNQRAGANNLGDQALIRFVWMEYQKLFSPVSFEDFTVELLKASAARRLVLVREDLVPEDRRLDYEQSQVRAGQSVYHFVRVQD